MTNTTSSTPKQQPVYEIVSHGDGGNEGIYQNGEMVASARQIDRAGYQFSRVVYYTDYALAEVVEAVNRG